MAKRHNRTRLTSIKEMRIRAKLTQPQVAELIGLKDVRTYQYLEDTVLSIKIHYVHKMCEIFNCTIGELLALPAGADISSVTKSNPEEN
ncbi:helix-turn-helix transcriptional regulator [Kamptonema sp. UHCC 0994]|uniref:helix-turn-helix transcriptional regulator n=1 Tax=Kamptonema sp. UHCC 0994 TaxID=3031329 RepID=UPI0023B91A42|nr:helix-turn-helix transcriptional regulator [Kamptonema sp. UHCC 0994]MDF0554904.1 helix-turn-helix transcriptional regulator [Kamptonema sp. UHCC 0994]